MNDYEPIETVTEWNEGERTVRLRGEWPQRTAIDGRIVRGEVEPAPASIARDGDIVTITLTDASVTYRIVDESVELDRLILVRYPLQALNSPTKEITND